MTTCSNSKHLEQLLDHLHPDYNRERYSDHALMYSLHTNQAYHCTTWHLSQGTNKSTRTQTTKLVHHNRILDKLVI